MVRIYGEMRGESLGLLELGFRAWWEMECESTFGCTPRLLELRLHGPEQERQSLRSDERKGTE